VTSWLKYIKQRNNVKKIITHDLKDQQNSCSTVSKISKNGNTSIPKLGLNTLKNRRFLIYFRPALCFILMYNCGLTVCNKRICYVTLCNLQFSCHSVTQLLHTLCEFFSSVFCTKTDDKFEPIKDKICSYNCTPIIITVGLDDVLKRLNKLNVSQSYL